MILIVLERSRKTDTGIEIMMNMMVSICLESPVERITPVMQILRRANIIKHTETQQGMDNTADNTQTDEHTSSLPKANIF